MDEQTLRDALSKFDYNHSDTLHRLANGNFDPTGHDPDYLAKMLADPMFTHMRAAAIAGTDIGASESLTNNLKSFGDNLRKSIETGWREPLMAKVEEAVGYLSSKNVTLVINPLSIVKQVLALARTVPEARCETLGAIEAEVGERTNAFWTKWFGGPVHEANPERLVASNEALDLNAAETDLSAPVDINKDVYLYAFCKYPLRFISEMTNKGSLVINGEEFDFSVKKAAGESACVRLNVLPDEAGAENATLIRAASAALSKLPKDKALEVEIQFKADFQPHATGKVIFDTSKLDPKKLLARAEKLAKIAEERATAAVELPDDFTKPYDGGEDPLDVKRLEALITKTWGEDGFKLKHMRRHKYFKTRGDWNIEKNHLKQPFARLTNALWSVIYEKDGKTWLYPEGIQFRQFYDFGKGKWSDKINILYTSTVKPVEISADKLKKVK